MTQGTQGTKDYSRAIAEATAAGDLVGLAILANELQVLVTTERARCELLENAAAAQRERAARRRKRHRERPDAAEPAEEQVEMALIGLVHANKERPGTSQNVPGRDTSPSSPSSSFPPTPPLTTPPASPPPPHTHRGRAREKAQAVAGWLPDEAHRIALAGVLDRCTDDAQQLGILAVLEELVAGRHGPPRSYDVVGRALVDFVGRGQEWNAKFFRAIAADLTPTPRLPSHYAADLDRGQVDRLCRDCVAKPGVTAKGRVAIWHEPHCKRRVPGVEPAEPAAADSPGSVTELAAKIGLGPRAPREGAA